MLTVRLNIHTTFGKKELKKVTGEFAHLEAQNYIDSFEDLGCWFAKVDRLDQTPAAWEAALAKQRETYANQN